MTTRTFTGPASVGELAVPDAVVAVLLPDVASVVSSVASAAAALPAGAVPVRAAVAGGASVPAAVPRLVAVLAVVAADVSAEPPQPAHRSIVVRIVAARWNVIVASVYRRYGGTGRDGTAIPAAANRGNHVRGRRSTLQPLPRERPPLRGYDAMCGAVLRRLVIRT